MTVKKTPESKLISVKEYYQDHKEEISSKRYDRRNESVRGRMAALKHNSKARAKRQGWEHDLTIDFLVELWESQGGLCALTGRELEIRSTNERWKQDLVSLDRVDSSKGYTTDNVWLVSQPVNYSKGVQTVDEFVEMCRQVILTHGG